MYLSDFIPHSLESDAEADAFQKSRWLANSPTDFEDSYDVELIDEERSLPRDEQTYQMTNKGLRVSLNM